MMSCIHSYSGLVAEPYKGKVKERFHCWNDMGNMIRGTFLLFQRLSVFLCSFQCYFGSSFEDFRKTHLCSAHSKEIAYRPILVFWHKVFAVTQHYKWNRRLYLIFSDILCAVEMLSGHSYVSGTFSLKNAKWQALPSTRIMWLGLQS